jgi:tRNA/tmRNA/rRNA uracil-C5-methylase (TrmA/RlmC/RlmD family)
VRLADALRAVALGRGLKLPELRHPEPFAHLDYEQELAVKAEGLRQFWQANSLPGRPDAVVPAPQPRGYRTTSKRRAHAGRGGVALGFPGSHARPGEVSPSALDPPEHLELFKDLARELKRPSSGDLAGVLNHAVVRGAAPELALILNVMELDAGVVRRARQVVEALGGRVHSAFLYLDPTASDYYLEAQRPAGQLTFKRLLGPEFLEVESEGRRLRFPPVVFSQVNGAMLPRLTSAARELLGPLAGHALVDLYCGYGLFALTLGREAAQVIGVDHDGPAIDAARANARHLGLKTARFVGGKLDAEFLDRRLPRPSRVPELALLDPPRQGTAPGVAEAVAERQPVRVLHVCCGADELPRELAAWGRAGYTLRRALPLDLFAGTAGLEILLLLAP